MSSIVQAIESIRNSTQLSVMIRACSALETCTRWSKACCKALSEGGSLEAVLDCDVQHNRGTDPY